MRGDCLLQAHKIINGERVDQHGNPENNFKIIAKLWSTYSGMQFSDEDVAIMMTLLKIARIITGTAPEDSYVDAAAYIALAHDLHKVNNPNYIGTPKITEPTSNV